MESMMLASVMLHPGALAILALAIFGAVCLGAKETEPYQRLSRGRLFAGFLSVFAVSLAVAGAGSYVSPEVALRFGVAPENYWSAIWREFATLSVLLSYLSLLGCAAFGVPIVTLLAKRRSATVPLVVAASVPVSLGVVGMLVLLSTAPTARIAKGAALMVGLHAVMAVGFSMGVRLPWRRPRKEA
ncbi:hypothetical protein [Hydrogenophaga luteola]|uniref:Uncharacterized protein n=1 Tax=Hydrogenophaga luteola TaxID=1591122 RepID=A0ABV7W6T3_9BURK